MELWIRSQDRETLIKTENISIDNENYIIGNLISDDNKSICDYWRLGHYYTKERALEVLDEIQNVLKPITVFKNAEISKETWEEIQKVGVCTINDRADVIKLDTFVYEMPNE